MSAERWRGGLSKNRLLFIGAILGLVGIAIGFIVYFSTTRISDAAYTDAINKAERARDIAQTMTDREDTLRKSGQGTPDQITADAKTLQTQFNQALDKFQQTPVYRHDTAAKKAYDESPAISQYSAQYINTLLTQSTIGKLQTACAQTADAKSYEAAIAPCREAVDTHDSVANKEYDDRYYQPYRKYIKDTNVASTSLSKVIENGDREALNDASQQYGAIELHDEETDPELPKRITQDPRLDFSALINILKQRKQQS